MPVPTLISSISQTPGSNGPDGATDAPSTLDNYMRAYASFIAMHRDGAGFTQEATVASASTADIGAATSLYVQITGTTTITSFGANYNGPRFIYFAGILTLTHNASTLILPGGANITTAAGDTAIAVPNGNGASGWRVVTYQRAATAPGAIADGSVTTAKIADSNVTTAKIAANAVTLTKLAREGTSGQVLTSGGAGADPSYTALPTYSVDTQTFDATATWTKPTGGQTMARIQLWGGGGGGSRSSNASDTTGGGGGGYNEITVPISYLASSLTVTVAAGGNGATVSGSGSAGGTSSIPLSTAVNGRTTIAAYGGGGGGRISSSQSGGGGGGQLSAGTTNGTSAGQPSIATQGESGTGGFWHGNGGSSGGNNAGSVFGGGGGGATSGGSSVYGGAGGANAAGTAPGGGGGCSNTSNTNGSNGAAGRVVITCW